MADAVAAELSLSDVADWDVTHLEKAARDWTATAQHWESSFTSIHQAALAPGGAVWEGAAAEAAQESTASDLVKVRGWADVLHESAMVARHGASILLHAKQNVLYAVEDAQAAGYSVNEDLSVTPPPEAGVAGEAQAQTYAADIQRRAGQLAAHDKEVAARITTTTAPLHSVTFDETSDTAVDKDAADPAATDESSTTPGPHNRVHLAGFGGRLPEDPPPPWQPPPPPYPQGQPVGPGLPPEGVHPPVDGPCTTGPASKPSVQAKGGQSLFDRNGGEWRYDPGQDRFHYPHWDYRSHATPNSQWQNIGIDGLPTHREGSAPPRTGTIGSPPAAQVAPAPRPTAPVPELPTPKLTQEPIIGGGLPNMSIGPELAPPPHAHPHWIGESSIEEWEEGQR